MISQGSGKNQTYLAEGRQRGQWFHKLGKWQPTTPTSWVGGVLKCWYPTTICFPTKKWSFWGVLGVPPFKETPSWLWFHAENLHHMSSWILNQLFHCPSQHDNPSLDSLNQWWFTWKLEAHPNNKSGDAHPSWSTNRNSFHVFHSCSHDICISLRIMGSQVTGGLGILKEPSEKK